MQADLSDRETYERLWLCCTIRAFPSHSNKQ